LPCGCVAAGSVRDAGGDGVAGAVGQRRQVDARDAPSVVADRGAAAVDDGTAGVDQDDADGLAVLDAAGAARQGDAVVFGIVDDVVAGDDVDADRRRGEVSIVLTGRVAGVAALPAASVTLAVTV
jgi:hypothetical protein